MGGGVSKWDCSHSYLQVVHPYVKRYLITAKVLKKKIVVKWYAKPSLKIQSLTDDNSCIFNLWVGQRGHTLGILFHSSPHFPHLPVSSG